MNEPASITAHPRYPWVQLVKEAKRRGANPDVFRRWLKDVDQAAGGTVLRRFSTAKKAKLYVNVKALDAHAGPSASERDAGMNQLRAMVDDLRKQVDSLQAFRKKANDWFKRHE